MDKPSHSNEGASPNQDHLNGARRPDPYRQSEIERSQGEAASRNPHIRSRAVQRLGELSTGRKLILEAIKDNNPYVRSSAAEALGRIAGPQDDEVLEALLSAIDDPNDHVTAGSIKSLGLIGMVEAIDQVLPCLADKNPNIVQAAVLAVARLAGPQAALQTGEMLLPFLDSPPVPVRLAAVRAMGILEYQPAAGPILAALQAHLDHPETIDLKLARIYIAALTRLRTSQVIPVLVQVARSIVGLRTIAVEALIELQAAEAAPLLAPLLADPSLKLRRHLVELMVKADYRAALPAIRGLLKDDAITMREAALSAIVAWQDREASETIRRMAFHDSNPFLRPQAVTALVSLLGADSLPNLQALAMDVNPQVRRAVLAGLAVLTPVSGLGAAILLQICEDGEPELAEKARGLLENYTPDLRQTADLPPTLARLTGLPPELEAERGYLLDRLKSWKAALADSPNPEKQNLDQALAALIEVL